MIPPVDWSFMPFLYPLTSAAIAAALIFAPVAAVAQSTYHVTDRWQVGGDGGWDYMTDDAAAHRLYLCHGPVVDVIDTDSGKKVGEIAGLKGTHGVALAPDGKLGYISDGRADAFVIFDRHTLKVIDTVPASASGPDGIAYEPVTKTVWAFDGHSSAASVLDAKTRKLVAVIKLPGHPEFPVADGRGFVFDNLESTSQIVKLNARTNKVVATYDLKGCDAPSGLAIDTKGRKLFSVCDNKVMAVVDANTGKVTSLVPIGEGPDAVRYDAKKNVVFAPAGGSGDMTVVSVAGKEPKVVQTVQTAPGARTMALDERTGTAYTATAKLGPKPAASASNPRGRPPIVPGTFEVFVLGK